MKLQRHGPAVFILLLGALFLSSCSSFHNPFAPKPDLTGQWKNRLGSVWTLRSDGTFKISYGGHFVTTGSYEVRRDKMTLIHSGGKIPWDGTESATYRFKLDKKNLRFVLLHDTCLVRITNLSVKWKKEPHSPAP
jgi:hypothetical protein